jgi:Rhodanese-like domain
MRIYQADIIMLLPSNTDTAVSMFERLLQDSKPKTTAPRRSIREGWRFSDHEETLPGVQTTKNNNSRDRGSLMLSMALSKIVYQVQEETKYSGFDSEPNTPVSNQSNTVLEAQRSRISSSGGASWSVFSETSNVEQPILKIDGSGPEFEGFAYISADTILQVTKNHVDDSGYLCLQSEQNWRSSVSGCSFVTNDEFGPRKFEKFANKSSSSESSHSSRRSSSTRNRKMFLNQEGSITVKEQRYHNPSSSSSSSLEDINPRKQINPGVSGLNRSGEQRLPLNSIFELPVVRSSTDTATSGHLKQKTHDRPPANSFSGGLTVPLIKQSPNQEQIIEHIGEINCCHVQATEVLNRNLIQQSKEHGKRYRLIILDCRFFYEYQGGHLKGALSLGSPEAVYYLFTDLMELLTQKSFLDDLLAQSGKELRLKDLQSMHCAYQKKQAGEMQNELKCNTHAFSNTLTQLKTTSMNTNIETESTDPEIPVFVLHCEFSSQRAPNMYNLIRQIDRTTNKIYPRLTFPQLFMIRGGYEACSKSGRLPYLAMVHDEFKAECLRCESAVSQEWKSLKKIKSSQSKVSLSKSTRTSTGISQNSLPSYRIKNKSSFANYQLDLLAASNQTGSIRPEIIGSGQLPTEGIFSSDEAVAHRLFGSLSSKPTDDIFEVVGNQAQFYSR